MKYRVFLERDMSNENKDLPAYPVPPGQGVRFNVNDYDGLTKLEAFTMAAMQGLCANPNSWDVSNETIASASVNLAKATLEALEKAK
jgi:hypothetical protein